MAMVSAALYHAGKFLQGQELLPESKPCPWCKFAGRRARVLPLQKSPDVWLLKCPACYAVSASRVASEAALETYYSSYYSAATVNRVTCGNPSHLGRHICRHAKLPRSLPKIAVLDFGGATAPSAMLWGRNMQNEEACQSILWLSTTTKPSLSQRIRA